MSGIVLSRDPAGERFLRIRIFDPIFGLKALLFALPGKRRQKTTPPDLFDEVECILKPRKTDASIPFLEDFRTIKSYRELATKPKVFITASEIARFYLKNGSHLLDPSPRLELLRSSLGSFQRTEFPQVVLLKLYYRFARDEGLPVRESWLPSLPKNLLKETLDMLRLPVDEALVDPDKICEVLESLKNWMHAETELRVE